MGNVDHTPNARLAVAGYASVFLLAWVAFVPGSFPIPLSGYHPESEWWAGVAGTAAISFVILFVLGPVFWFGPRTNRWLAFLVAVFPSFTFGISCLWLLASVRQN